MNKRHQGGPPCSGGPGQLAPLPTLFIRPCLDYFVPRNHVPCLPYG